MRLMLPCAIWLALSGLAFAQELAERPTGQLRLGRVSVTPTVKLTNLGVDTNVFNTDTDRQTDFTFTIEPETEGLLDLRRLRVLLTGGAQYVHFQQFDSERSISPYARGRAELRLWRRSTLFAAHSRAELRDRVSDEVDGRAHRRQESFSTGLSLGVTRNLTLDLVGGMLRTTFDDEATFRGVELRETLDRDTQTVQASVKYAATPLTTLILDGRIWTDRFPHLPSRDTESTEFRIGATFKPRALLAGRASVGYLTALPYERSVPDFRGVSAKVDLTYTLLEATQLEILVERGMEYSYERDYPYYRLNRYGGAVRRHLFGPADITVEAEVQAREYRRLASAGSFAEIDGTPDIVHRYASHLGFQIARRARLGIAAEYLDQQRGRAARGRYDGLRIGLTASYGKFSVGDRVE